MRIKLLAIALLAASQASAAELTTSIPGYTDLAAERIHATYDCAGQTVEVEYTNAGPVSLAAFVYDGEPIVAANVLSGSGARYAGRQYIWWTKGNDASLYDLMQGQDAAPVLECSEVR